MLIIKSLVNATDYDEASDRILTWAKNRESHQIIAANVHVVMSGFWHPAFQRVINDASLVTPDGMPLVWAMRHLGIKGQPRVYGPDLMLEVCRKAAKQGVSIYLYGGTEDALRRLRGALIRSYPTLQIAGTKSPPFRSLDEAEEAADLEQIRASGAGILFLGLGCPKQEIWAAKQKDKLFMPIISVGAAFDFIGGRVRQAPRWMMRMGLEWLFRLWNDPKRLWRRHVINDPVFVIIAFSQLLGRFFALRTGRMHRQD